MMAASPDSRREASPPLQPAMSLGSAITDEDIAAFKRDGFVLKRGMYTPEEISYLHDISKGEQCARKSIVDRRGARPPAKRSPLTPYNGIHAARRPQHTTHSSADHAASLGRHSPRAAVSVSTPGLGSALARAAAAAKAPTSSSTRSARRASQRSTTSRSTVLNFTVLSSKSLRFFCVTSVCLAD